MNKRYNTIDRMQAWDMDTDSLYRKLNKQFDLYEISFVQTLHNIMRHTC